MSSKQERFRVAVLDDYQNIAPSLADWSVLDGRATVTVLNDHLADADAVVERLKPFDIVCVMLERAPMTRSIIERLPKLRSIASTATRNASIDLKAAEERGVQVVHTGYTSAPTILDHPLRALQNLLATPHIGYVSRGLYARFYRTVANICRWLDGQAATRGDTPHQQSEK